ncbi:MAG: tetratricopeptide repeat protein [Holophagales bacterium]|nr:tetratricopeptide repeat protein [Holophagales bacterium]MYH24323.1 tetratricopeptide repeat protein [Holophagales bacterium]
MPVIYTGSMTRTAHRRPRVLALIAGVLVLAAIPGAAEAQKRKVAPEAKEQWQFGVDMANRGLWSEALFRFEQARRIEPEHPAILSNIAVAHEALGLFEEALDYYRQALRLAPRERDVRRNYSRFVEYYQSFKGDSEGEEEEASVAEEAARPASPESGGGAASGPLADAP